MINKHLVNYNYFEDANFGYLDTEFDLESRLDPDKTSAKLYDSFYHLFLDNFYQYPNRQKNIKISSWKTKEDFGYSFYVEDCTKNYEQCHILSTDYIGPSIYQMKKIATMTDDEIKSILKIARTLGGHIIWERGLGKKCTVNQAKGGDKGVVDRIDWTLLILKIWYEDDSTSSPDDYLNKIKKVVNLEESETISIEDCTRITRVWNAFSNSSIWLKLVGSNFKEFSDTFKLTGNFVDENYEVIELTDFFPITPSKYGYRRYIENNISAIELRNRSIIAYSK